MVWPLCNRQYSFASSVSPPARLASALCVARLMLYDSACTEPSQKTMFQVAECALPKLLAMSSYHQLT